MVSVSGGIFGVEDVQLKVHPCSSSPPLQITPQNDTFSEQNESTNLFA
jgi:hypothetical protein